MSFTFNTAGRALSLSQPIVMGILNVTPDSFFDGGMFVKKEAAIEHVLQMIAQGASIIDIGGESTRPGAQAVPLQQELHRVIPVIEAVRAQSEILVSVDTSKPDVMRAAVQAGANMINDVRALRESGALDVAAELDVPVCLMHMLGQPRSMQHKPHYEDVVLEVKQFLQQRVAACEQAGISKQNIIIDPGFGFGKTVAHNLALFKHLPTLVEMELPVMVGVSRKSMIGKLLDDRPAEGRVAGSVALAGLACWLGASILRVHDVAATVDALNLCQAVRQA